MSTLWLVATPIGNLGDLSPRAVEVLAAVDLVCCEDTRRTGKLLQHAGIRAKRLAVCNEHTEFDVTGQVLDVLSTGADVAVVSDAGSPGISDPGERLVAAAIDAGHLVSAVPGPDGGDHGGHHQRPAERAPRDGGIPPPQGPRARRAGSPRSPPRPGPSCSTKHPTASSARSLTCSRPAAPTARCRSRAS